MKNLVIAIATVVGVGTYLLTNRSKKSDAPLDEIEMIKIKSAIEDYQSLFCLIFFMPPSAGEYSPEKKKEIRESLKKFLEHYSVHAKMIDREFEKYGFAVSINADDIIVKSFAVDETIIF